jgi:predicted secreted protein
VAVTEGDLVALLDRALAAVEDLARRDPVTADGRPAQPRLAALAGELHALRDRAAAGGEVWREEIGALILSASEWIADLDLPMIAALGAVARAARRH